MTNSDSNALAAIVTVMLPLYDGRKRADSLSQKMMEPDVRDPSRWRSKEEADNCIKLLTEYKEVYERQLGQCEALDAALKLDSLILKQAHNRASDSIR